MHATYDLLRHFLAALAYRTQKALREAPASFGDFRPAPGVRTPVELVRHMTSVLGYARTFLIGGSYGHAPLPTLADEVARFHAMLEDLTGDLVCGSGCRCLQAATPNNPAGGRQWLSPSCRTFDLTRDVLLLSF